MWSICSVYLFSCHPFANALKAVALFVGLIGGFDRFGWEELDTDEINQKKGTDNGKDDE